MGCYRDDVRGDFREQSCDCGGSGCDSCGGGEVAGAGSGQCVKDTIRKILDAQRQVAAGGLHDCLVSCERSIDELLAPGRAERGRFTTIPFMLTCRHTCKPYVGAGFCGRGADEGRDGHFECIESPIFKVQGFVRGNDNCVRLELLLPDHKEEDGFGDRLHDSCYGSVCSSIGHRHFRNLVHTGVCVTVDLSCFCGISCLPATTPREFN